MATKKKVSKKPEHELLESSEALAEKLSSTEKWIEDNKTIVFIAVGVIVLAVAAVLFYRSHMSNQNQIAQNEMFQAQYWFESDSLNLALNGDGNNYGFLEIIDNYGSTKAGKLSSFYAGVCYMKQGEFDNALNYLSKFDADDKLVQARAYALIGDAHMELGEPEAAVDHYQKASNHYPNKYFTPIYLNKLAIAYEELADYDNSIASYDKIISEFHESDQVANARKHKARLEGITSK